MKELAVTSSPRVRRPNPALRPRVLRPAHPVPVRLRVLRPVRLWLARLGLPVPLAPPDHGELQGQQAPPEPQAPQAFLAQLGLLELSAPRDRREFQGLMGLLDPQAPREFKGRTVPPAPLALLV